MIPRSVPGCFENLRCVRADTRAGWSLALPQPPILRCHHPSRAWRRRQQHCRVVLLRSAEAVAAAGGFEVDVAARPRSRAGPSTVRMEAPRLVPAAPAALRSAAAAGLVATWWRRHHPRPRRRKRRWHRSGSRAPPAAAAAAQPRRRGGRPPRRSTPSRSSSTRCRARPRPTRPARGTEKAPVPQGQLACGRV